MWNTNSGCSRSRSQRNTKSLFNRKATATLLPHLRLVQTSRLTPRRQTQLPSHSAISPPPGSPFACPQASTQCIRPRHNTPRRHPHAPQPCTLSAPGEPTRERAPVSTFRTVSSEPVPRSADRVNDSAAGTLSADYSTSSLGRTSDLWRAGTNAVPTPYQRV